VTELSTSAAKMQSWLITHFLSQLIITSNSAITPSQRYETQKHFSLLPAFNFFTCILTPTETAYPNIYSPPLGCEKKKTESLFHLQKSGFRTGADGVSVILRYDTSLGRWFREYPELSLSSTDTDMFTGHFRCLKIKRLCYRAFSMLED
jgi:hypothetical protein